MKPRTQSVEIFARNVESETQLVKLTAWSVEILLQPPSPELQVLTFEIESPSHRLQT